MSNAPKVPEFQLNLGDLIQMLLMDAFVAYIGYRMLGWRGIAVVLGTYVVGWIVNVAVKKFAKMVAS